MKSVVFRFDIDTHKCIRDGVPNLLTLAEKYSVGFSFFLNTGRSIKLTDSLRQLFTNKNFASAKHLSAYRKLGVIDFYKAILLNPCLADYIPQIKKIINSNSELGLHGGRNHADWHNNAHKWSLERIKSEIEFGLKSIKKIDPSYKIHSFASPGWASGEKVIEAVSQTGFKYICDDHFDAPTQEILMDKSLKSIPTNILAEPGGVAFFENCVAEGFEDNVVVDIFFERLYKRNELAVVYDHPYFAGISCINILDKIIKRLLDEDYNILTIKDL